MPDTDTPIETDADGDPVIRLSPPPDTRTLERIPWEHEMIPRAPV